jgi:hypothetical protein
VTGQVTGGTATESGSVTAELAVGLLGLVLVLGAVVGVPAAGQAQLRCADAARAGAREAARGEGAATVAAVARHLAGPRADVEVTEDGPWVTVAVGLPVDLALPGRPVVLARASATALVEGPGTAATAGGAAAPVRAVATVGSR